MKLQSPDSDTFVHLESQTIIFKNFQNYIPFSDSTALDQITVGWEEDIYLQNKKVKKTKHFTNNMFYKIKLLKMKVDIYYYLFIIKNLSWFILGNTHDNK